MGKTSILREAQRRLAEAFPVPADWGEARYQPVLRTVIPSSPTSLKINLALLWKQGWPIRTNTHKTADLKVVDLLAEQGTRLVATRSEEHTSELQSLMRISYAVFCLKKKINAKK